ncbi:MAG: hypothetical protein JRJ19_01095 [Deltaproteobacteria bacterium]|nr:hypothetical protein [Deltaproteobacteria bacterium]
MTKSPKPENKKPGEFQLVLVLEKETYRRGESIPIVLRFNNVGQTTIELDGILPQRNSANPPYLEIESSDWRLIRVDTGIPRALMNDRPIIISPGRGVVLLQVDLNEAGGWIRSEEGATRGDFGKNLDRVGPELRPGKYSISGHFHPTPQHYWSSTEGVPFKVV